MVARNKLLVYIGVPLAALLLVAGIAVGLIFYYKTPEAIASESRQKLVIDHDGGADDAMAITMSLLNEKYFGGPQVVALTTIFGNVNLTQAIINSDRILTLSNRQDIPIYLGAERPLIYGIESDFFFGYDGLGDDGYVPPNPIELQKEPAAFGLLELSKKYEGELIIIALGPLTNIALAARMDPEFISRLAQLYVGGGHVYSDKYQDPEFNADMDAESYHIVAESASTDKVTLVPFSQVYATLNITKDWRENVLGAIQTPTVQALNGFEQISFVTGSSSSWTLLDPAVAAIALNNDIIEEIKTSNNSILLCGDQRGVNTNNFLSSNPNARVVYGANVDRYKKFLLDVFSAELSP